MAHKETTGLGITRDVAHEEISQEPGPGLRGSFLHLTRMPAECRNVPFSPYLATELEATAAPTRLYTAQMKQHFPWLCKDASTPAKRDDALSFHSQLESHSRPSSSAPVPTD